MGDMEGVSNFEPSTITDDMPQVDGSAFVEGLTDMLITVSSSWIEDPKDRAKYEDSIKKVVPTMVDMWNLGDVVQVLGEAQKLPLIVRLLGCLVTVGGTIYAVHPAGLAAKMNPRREEVHHG